MGPEERGAVHQNNLALIGLGAFAFIMLLALYDRHQLARSLDLANRRRRQLTEDVRDKAEQLDGALDTIHRLQGRDDPAHEGRQRPTTHTNPDCDRDADDGDYAGTDD